MATSLEDDIVHDTIATGANGRLVIGGIGRSWEGALFNWSLAPLQKAGDEQKAPELCNALATVAERIGIKRFFAPSPVEFNAQVAFEEDFTEELVLPGGVPLMRGVRADGAALLKRGNAFVMSSADCALVAMTTPSCGSVFAGHAGRDSIMDRSLIAKGRVGREYESVTYTMLSLLPAHVVPKLRVHVGFAIGAESFAHPIADPRHGSYNDRMVGYLLNRYGDSCWLGNPEDGKLDLIEIIRRQCIERAIAPERISNDSVDTATDTNEDGSYRWWSNRRGDSGRNLVFAALL